MVRLTQRSFVDRCYGKTYILKFQNCVGLEEGDKKIYLFLPQRESITFPQRMGFQNQDILTNETYFLRRVGGGGRVKAGQTCSPCGRGTELYH